MFSATRARGGRRNTDQKALTARDLFISDAAGGVTIAAGAVTVPVGHGWKLCFQKQYREFWIEPDGRGSFSRNMTPDVAMIAGTRRIGDRTSDHSRCEVPHRRRAERRR